MSSLITFNGSNYIVPATGEVGWGSNVSNYLIAIAAGCLQKTGGSFTLSAETDFGASFGLKSLYYKSRTASPATSGIIRLAATDSISFSTSNYSLTTDGSGNLTWRGNPISGSAGPVLSLTGTANEVNVSASTGNITLSTPQQIATNSDVIFNSVSLAIGSVGTPAVKLGTVGGFCGTGGGSIGVELAGTLVFGFNAANAVSVLPFQIGTNSISQSPAPYLTIAPTINWANINHDSIRDLTTISPISDSTQYASYDTSASGTGTNNYNHLAGYQDRISFTSSGTLTEQWSFYSQPTYDGGTVGTRYAIRLRDALGAGSLTTQYGLYIEALSRASTNWAIYVAGSNSSYFGGNVTVAGTSNQLFLGTTRQVIITAPTPATSSRTWTIPDISGNGTFAALEAAQTFSGTNTFSSTTILSGLTASTVPYLDSSKHITSSAVTPTELGYVSGVTSAIQTQIDGKSPTAGNSSLVTVGTVTAGTWSATTIAVNKGGTGQTSYTDGQLLIGNTTGNTLAKGTLTGTANQITVTNGSGSITLATPQDIGTGSSPTFSALTLTGSLAANFSGSAGNPIHGTNTSTAPSSGYVGEVITSAVSNQNLPASTNYGDVTSITLTAGHWLVSANFNFGLGSGVSLTNVSGGIGTVTGNDSTGLVAGDTNLFTNPPNASTNSSVTISSWETKLSGSQTYYMKMRGVYASGTPTCSGRITAVRIS